MQVTSLIKIFIGLVILTPYFYINASVLNRVVTLPNGLADTNSPYLQVEDKLYFIDADNQLFVTDGKAKNTLQLTNLVFPRSNPNGLVSIGNIVYFLRAETPPPQLFPIRLFLWRTDGTLAGTYRANDTQLILGPSNAPSISTLGNQALIIDRLESRLIITDGTQNNTRIITPPVPRLTLGLCAINENSFYLFGLANSTGSINSLLHFTNEAFEEIPLENAGFSFITTPPIKIGDECIYLVEDNSGTEQIVAIGLGAQQTLVTIPESRSNDPSIRLLKFEFQDKLYLARGQPNGGTMFSNSRMIPRSTILFEFTSSENQLRSIDLELNDVPSRPDVTEINFIRFSKNNVYVGFSLAIFFTTAIEILDSNFEVLGLLGGEVLSEIDDNRQHSIIRNNFDGNIVNFAGQDLLFDEDTQQLFRFQFENPIANQDGLQVIRSYNVNINTFIPQNDNRSTQPYVIATDNASGVQGIYTLSDRPTVSEGLNGLWSNPDFNRSGVNINTGLRPDGKTRDIFLSLLTYLDGQPFWLFGAAPISDGELSIELPLTFFTDINYLTAGDDGTSITAGVATLTVLGCNEINIVFDLDEPFEQRDINFKRLFDTLFTPLCTDSSSLVQ